MRKSKNGGAFIRAPGVHVIRAQFARMDTRDLETFLQVVRQGNFAAVARDQGIDPSSVSRAIASLEAEIGTPLFSRSTRQLALTEAGAVFAERVSPALEELVQAHSQALDASTEVRGRLRVTVSNAFSVRQLSPLLGKFCKAYPALELDFLLTESPVDLIADRIDVAVRVGNLKDSNLVAVPLLAVKHHVVASPDWLAEQKSPPQSPHVLEHLPCLSFAMLGFRDQWQFAPVGGGSAIEVMVHPRIVATNALLLRESALAGLGPALLSDWMIGDDLRAGRLVDLFPDWVASTPNSPNMAWAVYLSRKYVPRKVRVFVDFLKQELPARRP